MPTSVDLFSYPNGAGFKERGQTSQAAANSIEASGRAKTLQQRVLDLFQDGWTGTADECAAALGEHPLSIRPRLSQLRAKWKIVATGRTIKGDFGKPVHVWRAVP